MNFKRGIKNDQNKSDIIYGCFLIINTNYLTLQLWFSRHFPSFDVEVEKKIRLTSNGGHIINEITKGNIIFQNDINRQIKEFYARCDHLIPIDFRRYSHWIHCSSTFQSLYPGFNDFSQKKQRLELWLGIGICVLNFLSILLDFLSREKLSQNYNQTQSNCK